VTTQRRHKELPWGRLDLHLPEVEVEGVEDVEEVEKRLGPDPVPGAPYTIAGDEDDKVTEPYIHPGVDSNPRGCN
jgi:hypothetical protein